MSRIHHRQRARILKRDGGHCRLCPSIFMVDMHHIIPQREGGDSSDGNVISLCKLHHDLVRNGIYNRAALKELVS